jgi:hypothetical protein
VHQEIVAVALHIVADEFEIVAVGDVADALGEERLVGLDLFQSDRPLLAGDFRDACQFVDQIARRRRLIVKANFAPSGMPCRIALSGNRIRVAANEPPKMMMTAWMS